MEIDILDSLEDLGYTGSIKDDASLKKAIEEGPKSIEYTQLVEWLSKELKALGKLEDHINAITDAEDSSSFLLEVSSFLKELHCPYESLTDGPVTQRLTSKENVILLVDFLCSELQAARLISVNKLDTSNGMEIEMQDSITARGLKEVLLVLGIPVASTDLTSEQLFNNIENKLRELIDTVPASVLSKPLFSDVLTETQWETLEKIQQHLSKDYRIRREMLLKRLDVTVQSFKWAERLQDKEDDMAKAFLPVRRQMKVEPSVDFSDLLAAREDLAIIEKTSSASVRKNMQSEVYKVLMGYVPDRGGRPKEQRPPVEMPSWQKRSQQRGGGRGGNRGQFQKSWSRRGGRGGKTNQFHNEKSSFAYDAAGSYGQY